MAESGERKVVVVTGASSGTGEPTRTFRSEEIAEAIRFALEQPDYAEINEVPSPPPPRKH